MSQVSSETESNGIVEISTPPSSPRSKKQQFTQTLKSLINAITDADVQLLQNQGAVNIETLSILDIDDLSNLTYSNPIIKPSLKTLHQFLLTGESIQNKSVIEMKRWLANPTQHPLSNSTSKSGIKAKLPVQEINEFDGSLKHWVEWKQDTVTTLGAIGIAEILNNKTVAQANPAKDQDLYYVLLKATQKGTAGHVVKRTSVKSGHEAWQNLTDWFSQDGTIQAVIDTELDKLESLYLDENNTASQYISDFVTIELKLEEMGHTIPPATLRNKFLNHIMDPDFNTTVQILRGKVPAATLMECIREIRKQEDQLQRETREARSSAKIRRLDNKRDPSPKEEPDRKKRRITIPRCITRQVKDGARPILYAWAKLLSQQDRDYTEDEIMDEVKEMQKRRPYHRGSTRNQQHIRRLKELETKIEELESKKTNDADVAPKEPTTEKFKSMNRPPPDTEDDDGGYTYTYPDGL